MNRKRLKEILATHADQLVQGQTQIEQYTELSPAEEQELSALLKVAESIKSTLKPMALSHNFETDLKRDLLSQAQLRQTGDYPVPNPERDLIIVLAIIGFILSLAALLAAWRWRNSR